MAGWYHRLNGHEFEHTLGNGEGQGSLVYCSPWGYKEPDMTERLSNNNGSQKIRRHNFQITVPRMAGFLSTWVGKGS